METRAQLGAVPRTAIILVVLAVLLALLSAIAVGQQPSPKLPPPLGVAGNGLIAFDDGGDIYVVNPDGTRTCRAHQRTGRGHVAGVVAGRHADRVLLAAGSERPGGHQGHGRGRLRRHDGGRGVDPRRHPRTACPGPTTAGTWRTRTPSSRAGLVTYRVMVVPVAGGDPVEVASPGQDPTWSPDDRLIAFQSGGPSKDLTTIPQGMSVVGADGKGQRLIDGAATDNQWAYGYPQWSLDGQRLTYHAQLPNDNMHIDVAAADGGGIHAIDSQPPNGGWPVWSPDGTRVAFVGYSETDGGYRIAVMNPDGSDVQLLAHPALACNCPFKWSPDGSKVIAYQDGPLVNGSVTNELLLVIDVSGKVPVETIALATPMSGDMSWQRLAQ